MREPENMPGTVLAGRYQLDAIRVDATGSSTSAMQFDATDVSSQEAVSVRIVALANLIDPALGSTTPDDALAAYESQADIAASLRHPCIESVLDHGEVTLDGDRYVFTVGERLAGGSLREFLDRGRRLTPSQALIVGIDACRGLDAAAKQGITHGDLRPSRLVFGLDKQGVVDIAVKAATLCKDLEHLLPGTDVRYEYSPESFTLTEPDFAIEICEAVMAVIQPTSAKKLILNLPATVECYTPNVYGDVIEWFIRTIAKRDTVIISLHPHNDRGCAVAAAEFGVMAGADRVEGTLFGNGERTGNVDLITLAMNLFVNGVDPELDITDIDALRRDAEYCNRLPVPERQPYVGDLVYTAFSGSHQDAIKKGFEALSDTYDQWGVPYLPLDPKHVGRSYESVVRVNSQSGKGGVAYIMKAEHGFDLPRRLQIEFSQNIQHITEDSGTEISPMMLWDAFKHEYLPEFPTYNLISHELKSESITGHTEITAQIDINGTRQTFMGKGNGPIDAFVHAIRGQFSGHLDVKDYTEHALGQGSQATAVAYVETGDDSGHNRWGVGIDPNTITASLRAVLSAFQRHEATRKHK
mgnify:CR=1 FL=1